MKECDSNKEVNHLSTLLSHREKSQRHDGPAGCIRERYVLWVRYRALPILPISIPIPLRRLLRHPSRRRRQRPQHRLVVPHRRRRHVYLRRSRRYRRIQLQVTALVVVEFITWGERRGGRQEGHGVCGRGGCAQDAQALLCSVYWGWCECGRGGGGRGPQRRHGRVR